MGKKAECPSCFFEWEIDDDNIVTGEVISCADCGVDLEITAISNDTITLEKLNASDEDWGE
nr:lysine biosynthesis protein LysW [Candidatus Sigynarchaeota archaeon]